MGGPKILFCIVLVGWMAGLESFYMGYRHGVWRGSWISQIRIWVVVTYHRIQVIHITSWKASF